METTTEFTSPLHLPAEPRGRLQGIDVLRGIAVILVLFRHLTYTWPGTDSGIIWDFVQVIHRGGWIGVDLFFVLSGFLVRFKQTSKDVLQSIPAVALTVMLATLLNRSWNTIQYPWSFKANV